MAVLADPMRLQENMRRKSKVIIIAAAILAMAPFANGLVGRRPFLSGRASPMHHQSPRPTSMSIIDRSSMPPSSPSLLPAVSSFMPSNMFCAASNLIASDPRFEVELLNDVSFVALDLSEFLSPKTVWLRLCNVVGRILVLSSDMIQNDAISLEEWVFHGTMLLVSSFMFLRSAGPLVPALFSITALTVQDRRAYTLLFESVGVSVLQFKTLLSSKTLDWVEYRPNEVVELNGEFLYFLYSGGAAIPPTRISTKSSKNVGNIVDIAGSINTEGNSGKEAVGRMIFGDVQFAKALEASLHKKSKTRSRFTKSSKIQETSTFDIAQVIVGSKGATMMQISTSKLLQLMKNDNELSSSIQRLVLRCMQEKLSRTLQEGGLKSSSETDGSVFHFQPDPIHLQAPPNATYATYAIPSGD